MPRIILGCHNWGCYWHLVGRGCYTSHDTQSRTLLARRGSPRPGRRGSGAGSVRLATHSTLLLATERPCTRSGHAPSARCMHGAVRALPPPPASARHILLMGYGKRWPPWDRGGGEVREGVAAGLSGRQLAGRAPTGPGAREAGPGGREAGPAGRPGAGAVLRSCPRWAEQSRPVYLPEAAFGGRRVCAGVSQGRASSADSRAPTPQRSPGGCCEGPPPGALARGAPQLSLGPSLAVALGVPGDRGPASPPENHAGNATTRSGSRPGVLTRRRRSNMRRFRAVPTFAFSLERRPLRPLRPRSRCQLGGAAASGVPLSRRGLFAALRRPPRPSTLSRGHSLTGAVTPALLTGC